MRSDFIFYTFMLSVLVIFAGCKMQVRDYEEEDRTLKIVYTDWSEAVALTHLSQILLEEKMEYEVETKLTDVESAYQEVAEGDAHIFADAWLPETHKPFFDKHEDRIEQLGIIYPGARTGLVVPDYSVFHSIEELNNSGMYILGIDSGAGVMRQARKAIEAYGLNNIVLQNLSEQEMTRLFLESYRRQNEVVITGWEPHWIFARYDVRFLEDPDKVFGHKENIFAIGTNDLKEKHPHVVRFFERMQLSEKQINNLIYYMNKESDPQEGVKEWIRKNEYVINQWVKDLKPERKKIM